MEEIAMAAKLEVLALTPTASLFLSLSEELAAASKTFTPKSDLGEHESLKYPDVSLDDLSKAIQILSRVVKSHIMTCREHPRRFGLAALELRDVFSRKNESASTIAELLQLLELETDTLVRIRYLLCSVSDLSDSSLFCYLMQAYFYRIETESPLLGRGSMAITERAW